MRRVPKKRGAAGAVKGKRRERTRRDDLAEVFRRAPIGVLVIGALLFMVGAGLILGGAAFVIWRRITDPTILLVLFGGGPLAMYLALHFVARREWAWTAVVAILGLTLFSSVVRAIGATVFPVVAIAEIAIALGVLAYLFRPRVRGAFEE